MSHKYIAIPGWPNGPCAMCARSKVSHGPDLPVAPGTRLGHWDLLDAIGRCDGRCGRHAGQPFSHNDNIRLFGFCKDCPHRRVA